MNYYLEIFLLEFTTFGLVYGCPYHNVATIKGTEYFKADHSSHNVKDNCYIITYHFTFQTKAHLDILAEALLRWARGR